MGAVTDDYIVLLASACDDVLGACRDYFDNDCSIRAYYELCLEVRKLSMRIGAFFPPEAEGESEDWEDWK